MFVSFRENSREQTVLFERNPRVNDPQAVWLFLMVLRPEHTEALAVRHDANVWNCARSLGHTQGTCVSTAVVEFGTLCRRIGLTSACWHSRGRFERTHGGVLNGHTGVTHRDTHAHRDTHRHTENTHTQEHTRTHAQKTRNTQDPNRIKTTIFRTKMSVVGRPARARGRSAMDAQCGLKTPLEPLTESFTSEYLF